MSASADYRIGPFELRIPERVPHCGLARADTGIYLSFTKLASEPTAQAPVNTHFIGKSMILILFLRLVGRVRSMTKSATVEVQRQHAERQLFGARRALAHLVEMYDNGQWRHYYKKEEAFAEAVRDARQVVEQWTDIVNQSSGGTR